MKPQKRVTHCLPKKAAKQIIASIIADQRLSNKQANQLAVMIARRKCAIPKYKQETEGFQVDTWDKRGRFYRKEGKYRLLIEN